jgi:hypothetical protein
VTLQKFHTKLQEIQKKFREVTEVSGRTLTKEVEEERKKERGHFIWNPWNFCSK